MIVQPVFAATEGAILTVWSVSLLLGIVVILVVAVLLELVRRTAADIEKGAAAIWTEGKYVANNTIQIPLFLGTANRVADRILETAGGIAGASRGIRMHAESCPGCPDCVHHRTY